MDRHRIVVNAVPLLSKFTGIGKYTYEVCRGILDSPQDLDPTFYYGYYSKKLYEPDIPPSGRMVRRFKSVLDRNTQFKRAGRRAQVLLSKVLRRTFDLYWEPNTIPFTGIRSSCVVTTVHDFSFHLHPEWHPRERVEYFTRHFWKNIPRSALIITGSNYSKSEIVQYLRFDPDRVVVIPHGVNRAVFRRRTDDALQEFRRQHSLPERFLLFVGSIEPRKNLKNALLAYNSLDETFKKEHPFVLAGFGGWNNKDIMDLIDRNRSYITYLGYIMDDDLAMLYNLATVFIYPSLYEGFGLPPLEAMACGAPVITSRVASLPEVCGDAAYYVDPGDTASIAAAIKEAADNEPARRDMAARGLARSSQFDWNDSARRHVAAFNAAMQC